MSTVIDEEWKPVPGYEGLYEVSDRGGVRSLDRRLANGHRYVGQCLKPHPVQNKYKASQYLQVKLSDRESGRGLYRAYVHRLVLLAFRGPSDLDGCHRDGVRSNNCLVNLYWGTHLENMADRERHGNTARGMRGGTAKLVDAQVIEIRKSHRAGIASHRELAKIYGVSRPVISAVIKRKTWRHVSERT